MIANVFCCNVTATGAGVNDADGLGALNTLIGKADATLIGKGDDAVTVTVFLMLTAAVPFPTARSAKAGATTVPIMAAVIAQNAQRLRMINIDPAVVVQRATSDRHDNSIGCNDRHCV